jgi:hypothetical protein
MKLFAVLILIFVGMILPAPANQKTRLIHYGWENPNINSIAEVLPKLVASPFDGLTAQASADQHIFKTKADPSDFHSGDLAVLEKLDRSKLADSYLVVHSKSDLDFDWSNEAHFQAAMSNMRGMVRLAKAGGFKGIVFDMEPYGKNPWDYKTQAASSKLDFAAFRKLLQSRGEAMMTMMQTEFPGLDVWALYGLSAHDYLLSDPESKTSPAKVLAEDGYGLWSAYFAGWIKASAPSTRIIDGNEPSYYYTTAEEFKSGVEKIITEQSRFIPPELRDTYTKKISAGHAVFVDGVMDLHKSTRFVGAFLKSDAERLELLTHNTAHALSSSRTLVWVYAENPKWWTAAPDQHIDAALRNAKELATKPPRISDAVTRGAEAWGKRVHVGGKITDPVGNAVKPDRFEPAFTNTACAAYGDRGEFSCDFPNGSTFEIRPIVEGKRLFPAKIKGVAKEARNDANFVVQ